MLDQFFRLVLFLVGMAFVCGSCLPNARGAEFLSLEELSTTYRNYGLLGRNQRSPMTNPDPIKEGLNLDVKNDIFWGLGYANAGIKSATTEAQYRYIALEIATGFHLSESVDLGLYHLSEHGIDRTMGGQGKYPSANAIELKIYLFKRPK